MFARFMFAHTRLLEVLEALDDELIPYLMAEGHQPMDVLERTSIKTLVKRANGIVRLHERSSK